MKRFRIKVKKNRKALALLVWFVFTAMIPNIVLAFTEHYCGWSILAGVLMPLGFYMVATSSIRRTGVPVLLLIWVMILCAFQIVLLYLFGNSIIATDMFTNLLTTNPGEASELLSNIAPAIAIVVAIYGPTLLYAIYAAHKRYRITRRMRRIIVCAGCVVWVVGSLMLIPARLTGHNRVFLKEVFPANVLYNLKLCLSEQKRIKNYEITSADFDYNASRGDNPKQREIYVYMIGEASRAASWQMFGYERATNPLLSQRNDIHIFRNVLTQSNTTHKSVPLFLSSVGAANRTELYNRKGLAELFSETGFKTYFISNQSPQGAMVDLLANEADERIYIGAPRYDMQLLSMMRRIIESEDDADILFILHCYGSHFSYYERYPREFAMFMPDDEVSITKNNVPMIVNAYDNSIVYTDTVINEIIDYLASLDACSSLLYCSDHGEDILDDRRGRFLHASPTVTYYQIHIPALVWFSSEYLQLYPERAQMAENNRWAAATTHSMFHTMADIASIRSEYVDESVSLVSPSFDKAAPRYYLNDHNEAVPYDKNIGLNDDDMEQFSKHGINLK